VLPKYRCFQEPEKGGKQRPLHEDNTTAGLLSMDRHLPDNFFKNAR